MRVIIDTNVLLAGLLKNSIVRAILSSENITFFLPEYAINEIKKYKDEICKKGNYSKEGLADLLFLILENVEIIEKDRIKPFLKEAQEIMKDIDVYDTDFIASALAIGADGIWSFDKHFLRQKVVKIYSIKELAEFF